MKCGECTDYRPFYDFVRFYLNRKVFDWSSFEVESQASALQTMGHQRVSTVPGGRRSVPYMKISSMMRRETGMMERRKQKRPDSITHWATPLDFSESLVFLWVISYHWSSPLLPGPGPLTDLLFPPQSLYLLLLLLFPPQMVGPPRLLIKISGDIILLQIFPFITTNTANTTPPYLLWTSGWKPLGEKGWRE